MTGRGAESRRYAESTPIVLGSFCHAQQVLLYYVVEQTITDCFSGLACTCIPSLHPHRCMPPEGRVGRVEPRTTRRRPRVARLFPRRSCDPGSLRPLSTSPVGARRIGQSSLLGLQSCFVTN